MKPQTYPSARAFRQALDQRLRNLGGGAQLGWQEGRDRRSLAMVAGDTALVPASIPNVLLSPIGRLDVVVSDPGER